LLIAHCSLLIAHSLSLIASRGNFFRKTQIINKLTPVFPFRGFLFAKNKPYKSDFKNLFISHP
ncbi:MAG: hypothetical protein J6P65_04210, partial [Bacteroidales bacterium]|nr:hypothetical protein [Bacteroidales bacterium]